MVLMSICNQDMHGCMKNENWKDRARNQRDVELVHNDNQALEGNVSLVILSFPSTFYCLNCCE